MESTPFSPLSLGSLREIDQLYQQYKEQPGTLDPSWAWFFQGWELADGGGSTQANAPTRSDLRVFHLIDAYRRYGHLLANINPIAMKPQPAPGELALAKSDFSDSDLLLSVPTFGLLEKPSAPLQEVIDALKDVYCQTIGFEYMGCAIAGLEQWMQERIEGANIKKISNEARLAILECLNQAEFFETFIHKKYVGQKRFSLEGGETLIPMLKAIIEEGADRGAKTFLIGMAHRGRLNVLANVLNKPYEEIFFEFSDHYEPESSEDAGDVKYHKGFFLETTSLLTGKPVKVALAPNPSHLESVDPVVEGQARSAQEEAGSVKEVVPIIIHGDAAVAGQGVVYETLQFLGLPGYTTGGTLHIIINNQVGFTARPEETRSTRYCTAIASAFNAPVFHVNGDDPEAAVLAMVLATEIRQKFGCDVFIELCCYRKYGHNEGDEPVFTQPLEYQMIGSKKTVRQIYREKLLAEGLISSTDADKSETDFKARLQMALDQSATPPPDPQGIKNENYGKITSPFEPVNTSVPVSKLQALAASFCELPDGFTLHPKLTTLLTNRKKMVLGSDSSVDWAMAEHLAFATLLNEGTDLRLSGQDCGRGTFSQRHSVFYDQITGKPYYPLQHLPNASGRFQVYNSPLSEFAVLGFEFGYTTLPNAARKKLAIWEAQFGDFGNGAQIIIDQYLIGSEQRWGVTSNLTLMLPHGYEGQGAEHSSARIERFLQLCGDDNLRVANCTTPAQLFHILRAQSLSTSEKPLILFTPKAILRSPKCRSTLAEFENGTFQPLLDDPSPPTKARIVVFCSGKVFYDIDEQRKTLGRSDMALIRVEKLYPLDTQGIKSLLSKYSGYEKIVWAQEEHQNMGPWSFMREELQQITGAPPIYCGRCSSAVNAAGFYALHKKQQSAFMSELFTY